MKSEHDRRAANREWRPGYPIPSRLNTVLCLAQISASVVLLTFASRAESSFALFLSAALFALVMQAGFSLIHEAEHNKLHRTPVWNEALGMAVSSFFPASYHLLKVAHLVHHHRNRSDAELVDYIRPGERPWVKRLQYYLLICGVWWLMVPLGSVLICFLPERLSSRRRPRKDDRILAQFGQLLKRVRIRRVRFEMAFALSLWTAGFAFLHWKGSAVAWCYAAFGFFWANQQYIYHVRTPRHPQEGAFDLRLWRPLQMLYLNFNYHLTHHRDVRVPWIHLPAVARTPPHQGYLSTYLGLWSPPKPVSEAWPLEFQSQGPLPDRPVDSDGAEKRTVR